MNMHSPIRAQRPIAETAENYPYVALRWDFSETNGTPKATRIIECRNRIQWIIQHKTGGRWRNANFCRSQAGLERRLPGKVEDIRAAFPGMFPVKG